MEITVRRNASNVGTEIAENVRMPGEQCVGLALNLMMLAGDGVSDDGAASIDPHDLGGSRFVVERCGRYPVITDQKSLMGKSHRRILGQQHRQYVAVDSLQGITENPIAETHDRSRGVATPGHCGL
ncbi:MAG: hypothetical protein OJJ55_08855 [Rhodococcus sp.]|uniref:hypothetical protein n=1 Tax=Rhodococcus TaxID=1827 RepID=UPI001C4E12EA|nr:hypothetical protein [Rhodococcus qingshengii]MCW0191401.1 hypothetical protein [Rhodococcus sp. (in: high G+C Gram-positive bacteria)]